MNNERIRSNLACPHIYAVHNAYMQYHRAFALQHSGHAILLRVRMKRQRTRNRIARPATGHMCADTQACCASAHMADGQGMRTRNVSAHPHIQWAVHADAQTRCVSAAILDILSTR